MVVVNHMPHTYCGKRGDIRNSETCAWRRPRDKRLGFLLTGSEEQEEKMKKKTFTFIFSCFTLLLLSSVAFGAPGKYVSGNLGIGFLTDSDISDPSGTVTAEFDLGYALGVAAGYNFGTFRVEGELGYQKNDFDKVSLGALSGNASGDVTSTSFLLNGYYDFVNSSPFTPYISAGIGFTKLEANDFAVLGTPVGDADDKVLAYQLGVGVGYAINEKVTIDLKYRYFAAYDPEFDGTEYEYESHNIFLGLRYNF